MAVVRLLSGRARASLAAIVVGAPLLTLASCWLVSSFDDLGPHATDAATTSDAADSVVSETNGDVETAADSGVDTNDGACEADFVNDEHNCGACGHDCVGGACDGGKCTAVVLASGQDLPGALAIDDAYVYWTTYHSLDAGIDANDPTGAVRAIRKDRSGGVVTLASNQSRPATIVVDDSSIYWGNQGDGGVYRANKDGGAPDAIVTHITVQRLALDDQNVYWSASDQVGRRGKVDPKVCVLASHLPIAAGIALDPADGGTLYWTVEGADAAGDVGGADASIAAGIYSIESHAACPGDDFVKLKVPIVDGTTPFFLQIDDLSFFWSDINATGAQPMWSVRRSGGTPTYVIEDVGGRYELVPFGDAIYFAGSASSSPGAVGVVKKGNPASRVDYVKGGHPVAIAVEDCCVYWTDEAAGTINEIAR